MESAGKEVLELKNSILTPEPAEVMEKPGLAAFDHGIDPDEEPDELPPPIPVPVPVIREEKRGRGRPSKIEKAPVPEGELLIPSPPFRRYHSDANSEQKKPKAFLQWAKNLPQWAKSKLEVYVYRDFPILVLRPTKEEWEAAGNNPKDRPLAYIDKLAELPTNINSLRDKYGAGDYHVFVNEAGRTESRTVAEVWVKEGWRDWRSHPATDRRIDDIGQIVMEDPANASFIEFIRGTSRYNEYILKNRKKEEDKEVGTAASAQADTMKAASAIVDKVLEQNKSLVDRVMATEAKTDIMDKTVAETMGEAMKAGIGIITDSVKSAAEINRKEAAQPVQAVPAFDPMDALERAAHIIQLVRPASDNSADLVKTFMENSNKQQEKLMELQNKRIEFAERVALEAKVEANKGPQPEVGADGSGTPGTSTANPLMGQIDLLVAAAQKLGFKLPGSTSQALASAVGGASDWREMIPDVMTALNGLAQTAIGAWQTKLYFDNLAAMRAHAVATGQPLPPMAPMGPMGPPMVAQPQQHQQAPPQQQHPQQNGQQPQSQPGMPETDEETMNYMSFMNEIRAPLLNHVNKNLGGAAFAEWLIDSREDGEAVYAQLKEQGPQAILMALRNYPPIASGLVGKEVIVQKFVEDFCNMDAIREAEEAEAGGAEA